MGIETIVKSPEVDEHPESNKKFEYFNVYNSRGEIIQLGGIIPRLNKEGGIDYNTSKFYHEESSNKEGEQSDYKKYKEPKYIEITGEKEIAEAIKAHKKERILDSKPSFSAHKRYLEITKASKKGKKKRSEPFNLLTEEL